MHSKAFIFLLVFVVSWICLQEWRGGWHERELLEAHPILMLDPKLWLGR
jgi:hypothetical protein